MEITAAFNDSDIRGYIEERAQRAIRAMVEVFMYVGEKAVIHARSLPSPDPSVIDSSKPHTPNYIDWSANLRNSIGYVVTVDGEVVNGGGFNGSGEGAVRGKAYARIIARNFPTGIALIVVAGENYASYVAAKGYDVIDSAEQIAEAEIPRLLGKLGIIKT